MCDVQETLEDAEKGLLFADDIGPGESLSDLEVSHGCGPGFGFLLFALAPAFNAILLAHEARIERAHGCFAPLRGQ